MVLPQDLKKLEAVFKMFPVGTRVYCKEVDQNGTVCTYDRAIEL
jgi:hypothetical protein